MARPPADTAIGRPCDTMYRWHVLRDHLQTVALDHGCVGFGVTSADPFDGLAATMHERKTAGVSADLAFTYRDPAVAADVRRTFPWAERLVAVAFAYEPDAGTSAPEPGTMRIARFADGDQYLGLRGALDALVAELESTGARAEALSDDSRLVDRAVAVRAGIGWWGRSTMVLVPGAGPWVLLGSVATDAPLDVDEPMVRTCGTCTACIPACPTGAILDDGVLDVRRCLAHHLQSPGLIPEELRQAVGDRLYGCDDCLTSCPPGNRALEAAGPVPGPAILDILGGHRRRSARTVRPLLPPGATSADPAPECSHRGWERSVARARIGHHRLPGASRLAASGPRGMGRRAAGHGTRARRPRSGAQRGTRRAGPS